METFLEAAFFLAGFSELGAWKLSLGLVMVYAVTRGSHILCLQPCDSAAL